MRTMHQKFTPVGTVEKDHRALSLDLDGWTLGRLVIAAGDVQALLAGREVDIHFVQEHPDRDPFIGHAGRARPSRSGNAITVWVEGRMATVPRKALEAVVSGKRESARLSSPTPIIDADQVQRKAIDHDLIRSFV